MAGKKREEGRDLVDMISLTGIWSRPTYLEYFQIWLNLHREDERWIIRLQKAFEAATRGRQVTQKQVSPLVRTEIEARELMYRENSERIRASTLRGIGATAHPFI